MGLTPRQREAVALRMAQLNACEYGLALETSLGAESGVTSREVASFRRGFADDPKEQAILALVTKIIRDRGHNAAYVVDAALQVGLSFGEIIEVIALIGMHTFAGYLGTVAGIAVDARESEPAE